MGRRYWQKVIYGEVRVYIGNGIQWKMWVALENECKCGKFYVNWENIGKCGKIYVGMWKKLYLKNHGT